MKTYIFQHPVQAGVITSAWDQGQRIKVDGTKEYALSRGMAKLKRPREGDYLVQYPQGHIDILTPEDFTLKVVSGGADVH